MDKKMFAALLALVVVANGCLVLQAFSPNTIVRTLPLANRVGDVSVQTGDLVFRRGYGLVSDLLRATGRREQRFSHAGIVWIDQGKTYVLHMAAEPYSGLNRSRLSDFVAPEVASEAAVYRLSLDAHSQSKLIGLVHAELQRRRPFDNAFELGNGEPQYCTEWLANLLKRSGYTIDLPRDFVAPDDLYLQSGSQLVCTFGAP